MTRKVYAPCADYRKEAKRRAKQLRRERAQRRKIKILMDDTPEAEADYLKRNPRPMDKWLLEGWREAKALHQQDRWQYVMRGKVYAMANTQDKWVIDLRFNHPRAKTKDDRHGWRIYQLQAYDTERLHDILFDVLTRRAHFANAPG